MYTGFDPDQWLVSLLQEVATHSYAEVSGRNDTAVRLKVLGRRRRPSLYEEEIPSERALMPNYIISSLISSAGLDSKMIAPIIQCSFVVERSLCWMSLFKNAWRKVCRS